jgi:hypothetical protein
MNMEVVLQQSIVVLNGTRKVCLGGNKKHLLDFDYKKIIQIPYNC